MHWLIGFKLDTPLLTLLIFFFLVLLMSLNRLRKNFYKNVIRTRTNQRIVILFFLIAVMSSMVLKIIPLYQLTLLAIPLSVLFSYYFIAEKKRPWVSELILWSMIGLIAWNHF